MNTARFASWGFASVAAILLIVLVAGVGYWYWKGSQFTPVAIGVPSSPASTTTVPIIQSSELTDTAINYANGKYENNTFYFRFRVPPETVIEEKEIPMPSPYGGTNSSLKLRLSSPSSAWHALFYVNATGEGESGPDTQISTSTVNINGKNAEKFIVDNVSAGTHYQVATVKFERNNDWYYISGSYTTNAERAVTDAFISSLNF